jgi:hypothetical protein
MMLTVVAEFSLVLQRDGEDWLVICDNGKKEDKSDLA